MSRIKCERKKNFITEDNVNSIIENYGYLKDDYHVEKYIMDKASDKMLGFLADYWKLKVILSLTDSEKIILNFFIKAVSENASKADMVREMNLFNKEINFYAIVKKSMEIKGIKPWSPKLVSTLDEAIIFEDLNALGYKLQDKFKTFDDVHTKQALSMLARFHASSIVYEQKKRKELQIPYSINEEFGAYLDKGGYVFSAWFIQCMKGALAAIKIFSKYKNDKQLMEVIENRWEQLWRSGLDLSNIGPEYCNVICHRDLWNNNILFHYQPDSLIPDDCVMVDFQAVRCQPPAGDVMLLLYCNLEPKFREENMDKFLCYYHRELERILIEYDIVIKDVLTLESFRKSAESQRLWAIIVCACLMPQIWLDDKLITDIFCDTKQFDHILSKDKASFIKKMVESDDKYRHKVMQVFEEIVDRYLVHS